MEENFPSFCNTLLIPTTIDTHCNCITKGILDIFHGLSCLPNGFRQVTTLLLI